MKQLLLATATLVGLSSAALAAEPVALSDSQLDKVTAGQTFNSFAFPNAVATGVITAGPQVDGVAAAGGVRIGPTSAASSPLTQAINVPAAVAP